MARRTQEPTQDLPAAVPKYDRLTLRISLCAFLGPPSSMLVSWCPSLTSPDATGFSQIFLAEVRLAIIMKNFLPQSPSHPPCSFHQWPQLSFLANSMFNDSGYRCPERNIAATPSCPSRPLTVQALRCTQVFPHLPSRILHFPITINGSWLIAIRRRLFPLQLPAPPLLSSTPLHPLPMFQIFGYQIIKPFPCFLHHRRSSPSLWAFSHTRDIDGAANQIHQPVWHRPRLPVRQKCRGLSLRRGLRSRL